MRWHNPERRVSPVARNRPVAPVAPVGVDRVGLSARIWMDTVRAYYRRKIKQRLSARDKPQAD